MQALICQRLAAVARHLGSIEGGIEQARVVERVSTERQAGTHQAVLVLLLQPPMAQALARVVSPPYLLPLRRQLIRQGAAIVKPILRAARKAVPKLPGRAHVAREHACTFAVARFSRWADCAWFFQASHRTSEFRPLNRLSERMPEGGEEPFLLRRGVFLGGWQFGGWRQTRCRRTRAGNMRSRAAGIVAARR